MKRKDHFEIDVKLILAVFGILILILLIGLISFNFINNPPKHEVVANSPQLRAQVIMVNDCADCFDTEKILAEIQSKGYNITIREYFDISSSEGKALASKYDISKVPSILIFGNTSSLENYWQTYGEKRQDALVLSKQKPVYLELSSGNYIGRVKATVILAQSCKECGNLSGFLNELEEAGVVFVNKTEIGDTTAISLINKYNISVLPAAILSPEAQAYDFLVSSWQNAGTIENDGFLVLRSSDFPYYDVNKRKVRGLVLVTVLNDSSCSECYDASVHSEILQNPQGLNMKVSSTKEIDISSSEGKSLLKKYSITKVPTVIISGDADLYPTLSQIWPQVGTRESDGAYVFRALELMDGAVYRDLLTNESKKGVAPAN